MKDKMIIDIIEDNPQPPTDNCLIEVDVDKLCDDADQTQDPIPPHNHDNLYYRKNEILQLLSNVETSHFYFGVVNPTSTTGENGDVYINTENRTFWYKEGTVWVMKLDLNDNSWADDRYVLRTEFEIILAGLEAEISTLQTDKAEIGVFDDHSQFPLVGSDNVLYIDLLNKVMYIWRSGAYIQISTPTSDTPELDGTDAFSTGGAYALQENINDLQDQINNIDVSGDIFTADNFIGTEGAKVTVLEGESVTIETEFTSELDDSLQTVAVGGLASTTLSNLKGQSLRKLVEDMVAPTQTPTYTIPTISISSSTSLSAVREVGETFNTTLTVTAVKNDAGPYTQLVIRRGSTVLKTDTAPVQSSATSLPNQFGFADPNNPNYSYSTTFEESIIVSSGATTWNAQGNYNAGLPKQNNKNVTDSRPAAVRTTTAPQAASNSFTSGNITLNGNYRYFAGQGSSLPTTGAEVRTMLLGTSTIGQPSGNWDIITDGVSTNFVIAIPNSRMLAGVKNMNTNEDLSFTLSTSITSVPDASGTNQTSKVYTLTTAVAFGAGNVLRITIT